MLAVLMVWGACQEPVEGCLDIDAVNFNAATDFPCEFCCEYPTLTLALNYRAGLENFNINAPFEMQNGDSIIFTRAAFYVSDLSLIRNNEAFMPIDTIVLYEKVDDMLDSFTFLGNVGLINRRSFNINMGSFEESGLFDAVSLRFGLNESMNNQPIDRIPNQNKLAIQADSMHTFTPDGGYIFLKFDLVFPVTNSSRQVTITAADMPPVIEQLLPFQSIQGVNKTLNLAIDYLAWIEGVDFQNDADDVVRQKIVNNTANAWLFSQD